MTLYEYMTINLSPSTLLTRLNQLGRQGWHAWHMTEYGSSSIVTVYLARKIESAKGGEHDGN